MNFTTLEIVLITILCIIGLIAYRLFQHLVQHRQSEIIEEQFLQNLSNKIHVVNQEIHDDVFYWFDQDSGEFLVQGCDDQELRSALKAKFPDDIFVLNADHLVRGPDFELVKFT